MLEINDYYNTEEEKEQLINFEMPKNEDERKLILNDNEKVKCCSNYPKQTFLILGNEFCERFSYYGLRAILIIYLTNALDFSENTATALYHAFTMLCYFSPLFGAVIADGWIGKYKTIFYISLLYAIGNMILSLTAIPPAEIPGPIIALLIIGLATGGIKPCVSAFGGDQFSADQYKQQITFFSIFYFSINFGSLISTLITPLLRSDVKCFGNNDCYFLAFGIPAILMFISLIIFLTGHNLYKKYPPPGNVIGNMFFLICHSLKNKFFHKPNDITRQHWLDYGDDRFEASFISDVRTVLKVGVLLLPLPAFWALFDQQGSRWTLQATHMDLYLGSFGYVRPDQMQAINAGLILIFIPIFEFIIYPIMDKFKIPNRPLQRIVMGMIFASISFIIAGFIEMQIQHSDTSIIPQHKSKLTFAKTIPCEIQIDSNFNNFNQIMNISVHKMDTFLLDSGKFSPTIKTKSNCNSKGSIHFTMNLNSQTGYYVVVSQKENNLTKTTFSYPNKKSKIGNSYFGIFFSFEAEKYGDIVAILQGPSTWEFKAYAYQFSNYKEITPGKYLLLIKNDNSTTILQEFNSTIDIHSGAVYTLFLSIKEYKTNKQFEISTSIDVQPNKVSIFYQFPQYIIITAGEIMFSITGLSFAYSQAPASMKSVVTSFWLLTVAVGNLFVIFITKIKIFENQAHEFFFFASFMVLITVIFSVLTCFYQYVTPEQSNKENHELLESSETAN